MIKFGYKKIFLAIFLIWIALWVNFTIRDLAGKKYLKEYKILLSRDAIGKASYVYGDRFFEFLKFCDDSLPKDASYGLVGIIDLDFRRTIYYLYPRFEEKNTFYLLVFDKPGYAPDGYVLFKALDSSRFILKRI